MAGGAYSKDRKKVIKIVAHVFTFFHFVHCSIFTMFSLPCAFESPPLALAFSLPTFFMSHLALHTPVLQTHTQTDRDLESASRKSIKLRPPKTVNCVFCGVCVCGKVLSVCVVLVACARWRGVFR